MIVLNNFRSAQGAEHRHGDRTGCLKGTRGAILDEIELWIRDFDKSPVYWLNGLAGTGKTTIAQTIAERTFADGRLGASFFCSRDFEDRSNLRLIFPTLAVQLARKYTAFRSVFVPLAQSDPGIAHESLYDQMEKLIVRPLTRSATSTVIVIDALDECKDEETTSAILSVLGRLISKVPTVKFLLTGRPEPRIQTGFRLPLLKEVTDVFVLHDVQPKFITNDVRVFLKHSFLEITNRRGGLNGWPTDEEVERLCERAAGLFVYAVATVKFIDKRGTNPRKQLDLLLQSPESSLREAKTKLKTNTTLDSLYTSILQEAFDDDNDPDNDLKVRSVLGAMLLAANPVSPSTIAELLRLDADDVFPLLSSVQSLLILQEDINCPVRPFHKSFPDFIVDPDRCTNQRFRVSPPHHHSQLLIGCLDLMGQKLGKNMCKLPDGASNSDVDDLKERAERYIDPALRYACRSWHTHLVGRHTTSVNAPEIASALHRFLETKFLFWLEALSVLSAVRIAVDALRATEDWLAVRRDSMIDVFQDRSDLIQESPTLDLANDCSRFVTRHFEIISTSSPHIYHSALTLTPKRSIIRKLYEPHAQPLVRVVQGIPPLWDPVTAAVTSRFVIDLAVWSPCSKFIAITPRFEMTVDILDPATLQRLQSLKYSRAISPHLEALAFSPDSRIITSFIYCVYPQDPGGFVVSWDLQTGGVISVIDWNGPYDESLGRPHIVYSGNGQMVSVLSQHESSTAISIYDVVAGVHIRDVDHAAHTLDLTLGASHVYTMWTHDGSIRFATPGPTGVTIWEVELAPGAAPAEVEILPVPYDTIESLIFTRGGQSDMVRCDFHHPSHRLAFTCLKTVLVWDGRTSKNLLQYTDTKSFNSIAFSSDGRIFASSTMESDVYLWSESPTGGYIPFETLTTGTPSPKPYFSPNNESIITISSSRIQSRHAKRSTTASRALAQTLTHTCENFILEFFPDRPLAVGARRRGGIVTVLDLESGRERLTIQASMEVYGLRPIESTIAVIGDKEVVTWDLPGGNFPLGVGVSIEDSAQTISFSTADNSIVVAASVSLDLRYIALARPSPVGFPYSLLEVCCPSTGQRFQGGGEKLSGVKFAASERDIWCANRDNEAELFTITPDTLDHIITVGKLEYGLWGCPWGSSCGYEVTNDWWILGAGGKRLLMLPPLWQSQFKVDRVWNGKFLGLVHGTLPDVVILELEP